MIKIYPRLHSVVGATMDRIDVRRASSLSETEIGKKFVDCVIAESGAPSNNPITMIKNWKRAYDAHFKRNMMVSNIEDTFKKHKISTNSGKKVKSEG